MFSTPIERQVVTFLHIITLLLLSTRDNESRLLQQAKDYSTNLDKQALELEKADNFPDSSNTEVAKLRQQLLKHNNELAQAEERQYQLEYKIEWYEPNINLLYIYLYLH